VNVGETVLSFFTGRSKSLSTAATRRRQVVEAAGRLEDAQGELAAAREAAFELEQELERKIQEIEVREGQARGATTEREIRLDRQDVRVVSAGVLWIPVSRRL
jgi:hypothetical protein